MLVLLCVQVVQIDKNESGLKEKKNNFLMQTSKRYASLPKKQKHLIKII
jgi:hypothetical protein